MDGKTFKKDRGSDIMRKIKEDHVPFQARRQVANAIAQAFADRGLDYAVYEAENVVWAMAQEIVNNPENWPEDADNFIDRLSKLMKRNIGTVKKRG